MSFYAFLPVRPVTRNSHASIGPTRAGRALRAVLAALALVLGAMGQARADFMYWTENVFSPGGRMWRANLDGTGATILMTGLETNTASPTLDLAGGLMYWTSWGNANGAGKIWRANLDGSGQQILRKGLDNPGSLRLDIAGGQMYWVYNDGFFGTGGIQRANLDGSGLTTLVSGINGLHAVILDVPGGKMYLSQGPRGQDGSISRYNLDGSDRETILSGLSGPFGMVLDIPRGKIYWADTYSESIRRANLDGSAPEILAQRNCETPGVALDLARGKLYWNEYPCGKIGRANLDGSGQEIFLSGLLSPAPPVLQLDPIAAPVPVTGFSADVISDQDQAARFAQPFDAGTFAWFEAGAVDDNGVQHEDGLPAGLTFLSATGSRATYQIQPANANNVLQLGAGQTGIFALPTPAAYSTLYVLASSGDGTPSSVGSGMINFSNGSTQDFSFNCFDWCNAQGRFRPEAVLTGPTGRADIGSHGTAFIYNQDRDFQIYETVIAIDLAHAGVAIVSIEFTGAPDAFVSNIFGLSGL
jgi:hypothetical protein